ncbi:NADH-quinone oxidoreductase subunit N [Plantactinospora sp. KLBMP9567]|uniref:NADH-quinone oxidoreductase subunit N n=1 Tax=Plantactinospora sp. KLBMP9567 TaxID=3085900 RepID=UPI002981D4B4|nr:NADH-quinone oxidoreductase subunit N [Plantactinospora sp. KLBMP9567]MDW5327128.1 NADH-quinone oxidoreductase subunit N [Plantactinospora sp. KLBMP9567]
MNQNVAALIPEAVLAAAAVIGLIAGSWLPRRRQWAVRALLAGACLIGLTATTVSIAADRPELVFENAFAIDPATNAGRLIVFAALLLVICLSIDTVQAHKRESEFYVLLALSATGVLALVGANDLLMLFAGYLLTSVPTYGLVGFAKDHLATEAALKYYLIGALLSVLMLAGIALLYAAGHTTGYDELRPALADASYPLAALGIIGVYAGLLFKIGGVPVQFWVPDAVDGTPPPVAAYLTTLPKIGGLIAAYRVAHQALPASQVNWPLLAAVLAAASMTLGNLAAFHQTSVKRLLAYSTINQVGYLLIAVAVATRSGLAQQSLLFYLAAYAVTNLGAFAVVAHLPHASRIDDYRGLAHRRPLLAAVLVVCLLGLVGTPPTAVFVGKLEVFTAAIDGGYGWLAALAVANTIASLFYYLRWLVPAFQPAPDDRLADPLTSAGPWSALAAYTAGAGALVLGLISGLALPLAAGPLR